MVVLDIEFHHITLKGSWHDAKSYEHKFIKDGWRLPAAWELVREMEIKNGEGFLLAPYWTNQLAPNTKRQAIYVYMGISFHMNQYDLDSQYMYRLCRTIYSS